MVKGTVKTRKMPNSNQKCGQEYCQDWKNAKLQSKVWSRVLSRDFVGSFVMY